MRPRNAMQLKAIVKAKAKESDVSPQMLLQGYMMERLLERISLSSWRQCFVIKGGMLISSLIGCDKRSTKDLDATIRGIELSRKSAELAFRDIISIEVDDAVAFRLVRIEDIRDGDEYPGLRVFLKGVYENMEVPLTVDATTGDRIVPGALEYDYKLLFENRSIKLMAYPVETVIAEKIECILSRGTANTRLRDYYDVYMLWRTRRDAIDISMLKASIIATAERRGSMNALGEYRAIVGEVRTDEDMASRWGSYSRRYSYAKDISFSECCKTATEMLDEVL